MNYSEALTALIDQQYAHVQSYTPVPGFDPTTRDEVATGSENIRISATVMQILDGDALYKADDVEYGVFDNCREFGMTVTVIGKTVGWTFCVYEHRNSDNICIEGCPTNEVKPYGPYGGEDKYNVLASFKWKEYHEAAEALVAMIQRVRKSHVQRDDLQLESGK